MGHFTTTGSINTEQGIISRMLALLSAAVSRTDFATPSGMRGLGSQPAIPAACNTGPGTPRLASYQVIAFTVLQSNVTGTQRP